MFSIATLEELSQFARTNQNALRTAPKAIVLEFQGLNRHEYFVQPSCDLELELAHNGMLYVIPYAAPWSWMNEATVRYTNRLLNEIFRLFALPAETPIVSTGYSMGGLAALMYSVFAEKSVCACMANSPVCDLVSHFHERDDIPRTLVNAFITCSEGLEEGVKSRSPLHQLDRLPNIPYFIVAGEKDTEVQKKLHADRLVNAMRQKGLHVRYRELPNMRHWQIDDYAVLREAIDFVMGGYQSVVL